MRSFFTFAVVFSFLSPLVVATPSPQGASTSGGGGGGGGFPGGGGGGGGSGGGFPGGGGGGGGGGGFPGGPGGGGGGGGFPGGPGGGGGQRRCPNGQLVPETRCCVWFDVLNDLQTGLFGGAKCENGVHKALRLLFHDSIGWSPSLTASGQFGGGGSDGSIIEHSGIELTFPPNGNLEAIVETLRATAISRGVSYADIVQFAGVAGTANCRGAPRLEFLAGRANSSQVSPPGLVPGPASSVTNILARMADAGFTADETVDLLASHSIAAQQGLNTAIPGSPLDSTPEVFDGQFFVETLLKGILNPGPTTGFAEVLSPLPGEFRMQSDFAIARDPRTACRWQSNINNGALLAQRFRAAMVKLGTLGNNRNALHDCSFVIPTPRNNNQGPRLPAGKTLADIEASCPTTPFPNLPVAPGPAPSIAPVPI